MKKIKLDIEVEVTDEYYLTNFNEHKEYVETGTFANEVISHGKDKGVINCIVKITGE